MVPLVLDLFILSKPFLNITSVFWRSLLAVMAGFLPAEQVPLKNFS